MTKEQFWRIIEDVNAVSPNHDQETVWTRIVAAYKQGTPGFFDLPFYSIASLYSGYVS